MFSNGLLGMAIVTIATFLFVAICASETKENFDKALAKEIEDANG